MVSQLSKAVQRQQAIQCCQWFEWTWTGEFLNVLGSPSAACERQPLEACLVFRLYRFLFCCFVTVTSAARVLLQLFVQLNDCWQSCPHRRLSHTLGRGRCPSSFDSEGHGRARKYSVRAAYWRNQSLNTDFLSPIMSTNRIPANTDHMLFSVNCGRFSIQLV